MDKTNNEDENWSDLTYEQKEHALFLKQKNTLDTFLEHGAISKDEHDRSLHDLAEKMGEKE